MRCSICGDPAGKRSGLCKPHYMRLWRYGDPLRPPIKLGQSKLPEYHVWQNIKDRCCNPRNKSYKNYGGRDIRLCAEWESNFLAFYEHVGPRPSRHYSIDRINNNGNYEPGNVKWSTEYQQSINRRSCHYLTYRGSTLTIKDWSELLGIRRHVIYYRLKKGWPLDRVFTTPVEPRKRNPRKEPPYAMSGKVDA